MQLHFKVSHKMGRHLNEMLKKSLKGGATVGEDAFGPHQSVCVSNAKGEDPCLWVVGEGYFMTPTRL